MNLYKVNIISAGNGWTDAKQTEGEIIRVDGAICVKYTLDGDKCCLTVKDGKVTQKRTGEQCIEISFAEGKETECVIGSGGLSGCFKIFTRSLKFIFGKCGLKLSLEYLNGNEKELIKLTFTAVKKGNGYEN